MDPVKVIDGRPGQHWWWCSQCGAPVPLIRPKPKFVVCRRWGEDKEETVYRWYHCSAACYSKNMVNRRQKGYSNGRPRAEPLGFGWDDRV